MVIPTLETTPSAVPTAKSAVNIFIKNESDGKVSAMVLGLPEYRVESCRRILRSIAEKRMLNLRITMVNSRQRSLEKNLYDLVDS